MTIRHVFGPVNSRRLGMSLGIDPVPRKLCSMDCVYCEVGPTDRWTMDRREWIPTDEILEEVRQALASGERIDTITFTGSGEPVLHSRLGYMIDRVREMSDLPICVLTNGSHLDDPAVRAELMKADIIAPSLDAVSPRVFEAVDKPHPKLKVEDIVAGLIALREEFSGRIWLEVLFVSGMNDSEEEVELLARTIERIRPDRVHISTVIRPPAYENVFPVSLARLTAIRERFGPNSEIVNIANAEAEAAATGDLATRIYEVAYRRPVTREDLADALGLEMEEVENIVRSMLQTERLNERVHEDRMFLEVPFEVDPRRPPRMRSNAS